MKYKFFVIILLFSLLAPLRLSVRQADTAACGVSVFHTLNTTNYQAEKGFPASRSLAGIVLIATAKEKSGIFLSKRGTFRIQYNSGFT